jgi:type I restriction enzyme S subunit
MNLRALNKTHKKVFKGKTVPLIDLCLAISDCPHYTPNWTETGELVIRNFNIKGGRLDLKEKYYTDKETFADRIRRHKPEPGDLIITREAPMGEVCIIPDGIECCLGQRMVLIKPNPKKVNNRYLLYAMLSEFVQKQIRKSDSSGSIVSNLCIPDLEQLSIPYVPLGQQEKIALVLDPIFEKIEINDKINTELENLAKTIYNYWFVQFDFPNEEGKPYKTSGGEMVWNEELKRGIPKGWEVFLLKEKLEFERGVEPGSDKYFEKQIDETLIPFFKVGGMNGDTDVWIKKDDAKEAICCEEDILLSLDGSVGRIAIGLSGAYSSGIRKVYPKNGNFPKSYIYFLLHSDEIQQTIKKNATGSNILHAAKALDYMMAPYNANVVESFDKLCNPIFNKILATKRENQELIKLRDFLLPLLMNGQVKIKSEATEQLSMAAEPQVKYGK